MDGTAPVLLEVDVSITCPAWADSLSGPEAPEAMCSRAALAAYRMVREHPNPREGWVDLPGGDSGAPPEVSIVLSDDENVRTLNRTYREKDRATNVLSFPALEEDQPQLEGMPFVLGDVIIAHGVAAREAEAEGKTLAQHLSHLIVHGMLHLLGFDHDVEEDARTMEALEVDILASLDIPDPYADQAEPVRLSSGSATDNGHG